MENNIYYGTMVSEDVVLGVLGNAGRRRLLMLLASLGELCVCELFQAVSLPQATVSRHLAMARQAGLVEARRQGVWMYYRLSRNLSPWITDILSALQGGPGGQIYHDDRRRLQAMPNRPTPCCDH